MPAECINVLLILTAKEGPLEELIRSNEASCISGVHLTLDHAFEDREYLAAHLTSFCHRELEEKHGDVPVNLVGLAWILAMVKR